MNFEQWIQLDDRKREAKMKKWKAAKDNLDWKPLIEEAAKRFRLEYAQIPGVNGVFMPAQSFRDAAPAIQVVTALYPPSFISNIPRTYFGFKVEQQPIGLEREKWVQTMKAILTRVAGWSAEDSERWIIANWKSYLDGVEAFSYHDDPIYLVLPAFSSPVMQQPEAIKNQIYRILAEGGFHPDQNPNYHWEEARKRIKILLA